jgi:hypothetical protein
MILDTCIVTVIIIIIIIVTIATAAPNNNNKIALAVWAIIDMVLQLENTNCKMVAVGCTTSYHGPPSTSLGSKSPLWEKTHQVKCPVPIRRRCR